MATRGGQRGFSLVELLVGLTVFTLAMAGLAGLLIQNSRINKQQQLAAEVQANARNCLTMIVAKLRSAGWDPMNSGIPVAALDADLSDDVSEIELFADLVPAWGATDQEGEQVRIRHSGTQIEWRTRAGGSFVLLADNISNDEDGDGTPEPMFVPDDDPPSHVLVQITAQSPVPDPVRGEFIRYTVRSDVALRKSL